MILERIPLMTQQSHPVTKTERQWRSELTPAEYEILRAGGTEPPHVGAYTNTTTTGVYSCRACQSELFSSSAKFDSHCGWPSFFTPLAKDRVQYLPDNSMGTSRVEVRCAQCGSHLGHVFEGEGYQTPTDQRYCINSICLTLKPSGQSGN